MRTSPSLLNEILPVEACSVRPAMASRIALRSVVPAWRMAAIATMTAVWPEAATMSTL